MSESQNIQEALASQFGLVYKSLYFVEYKDPIYPCDCECHLPGSRILHCMPCCYDQSYKKVLMYDGVYVEPDRTIEKVPGRLSGPQPKSRPSRGKYFLFTDPDPLVQEFRDKYFSHKNETGHTMAEMEALYRDGVKIRNGERHIWFSQIGDYTVTLHRRAWDKLPKNRHEPVDLPIDFSNIKESSSGLL
jgi:hypothetical protein